MLRNSLFYLKTCYCNNISNVNNCRILSEATCFKVARMTIKKLSTMPNESLVQTNMGVFRFSDYDCIGFDLDNTIVQYKITNVVQFEYEVIANFLVKEKGYHPKHLKAPITSKDLDFMQKGLFIDALKGNILKISPTGKVHNACHGTKMLSLDEIEFYYPNREWRTGKIFCKEPLQAWNGPLSLKIRTLLDYIRFKIYL